MKTQGNISRYFWTKYKDVAVAVGDGSGDKSKKKRMTDMLWAEARLELLEFSLFFPQIFNREKMPEMKTMGRNILIFLNKMQKYILLFCEA